MTNSKSRYTKTIVFVVCLFCLSTVRMIKSASLIDHEIAIKTGAEYVPGQLLVRFAPKVTGKQLTASDKTQLLTNLWGATIKREYNIVPGLTLVKLPQDKSIEEALLTMGKSNDIIYAHPNYLIYASLNNPNDSQYKDQWGVNNTCMSIYSPALRVLYKWFFRF